MYKIYLNNMIKKYGFRVLFFHVIIHASKCSVNKNKNHCSNSSCEASGVAFRAFSRICRSAEAVRSFRDVPAATKLLAIFNKWAFSWMNTVTVLFSSSRIGSRTMMNFRSCETIFELFHFATNVAINSIRILKIINFFCLFGHYYIFGRIENFELDLKIWL